MIGAVLAKRATRSAFATLNQKDLDGVMRAWADDGVFEFPGRLPVSGKYEGKQAIESFFRTWFDKMATIRFSVKHVAVERIFALGATNAVTAEWDVVETDQQGRTYHVSGVTVLQARGGKLVRVRDYIFDLAPLEEAWGTVETTSVA
jgi:ketosteroid isomerase-like protein